DVVRVHRIGENEVAVGIEPAGELVAVKAQVALDGEQSAPAERAEPALPAALEAVVELGGGAVVEQGHPTGERQTAMRAAAIRGAVVVAARECRVAADRLVLHRV